MPRLLLVDDDGTTIMDIGEVSPANVSFFMGLIHRHRGAISTAAAAVRLGRELLGIAAPPPRRALPRRPSGAGGRKKGHA